MMLRIASGLLLTILLTTSCVRTSRETYRDQYVKVREQEAILYPYNVHGSKNTVLTFNGKMFTGVRGLPPYYLKIPELKAILFVTEQVNGRVVFHVFDLQTKKQIRIDGGSSGFGGNIGSGIKPGEKGSDYVEKVDGRRIWLSKRSFNWKETWTINLETKSVEQIEGLYFDSSGQVTNRYVQPPSSNSTHTQTMP